jgi:16S rRNA processing protein RimM
MADSGYVIVGRIKRAHGIRGEIVVEPLTDEPDAIFVSGRSVLAGNVSGDIDAKSTALHVSAMRPFGRNILLFVDELTDRSEAEQWTGRYLLIPGSEVAPPAEGEVFVHELPGMTVTSPDGSVHGEVVATYDLPQGLMLEVKLRSGSAAMLPFRAEMIASVDRAARTIVANVPEGLFDA